MMIGLTKMQADILRHRLEVPDAICDAIGSDTDQSRWHFDDVDAVCSLLLDGLGERHLDTTRADEINQRLTLDVLEDCVTGSTYYACARSDGKSELELANIVRAGDALSRRIGAMGGCGELDFPAY